MILKITLSFENDKQTKYQWSRKVPSIQGKYDTSYILFAERCATIIEKILMELSDICLKVVVHYLTAFYSHGKKCMSGRYCK